jgi:hypothetical protein
MRSHAKRNKSKRQPSFARAVRLEVLEDRCVPDAGGTLRTALNLGAASSYPTVTTHAESLTGQDIDRDDYFRFSTSAPGIIRVKLTGLSENANLRLIRDTNDSGDIDSGEVLDSSYLSGTSDETITDLRDASTLYYIHVEGGWYVNTNYTLTVSVQTTAPAVDVGDTWATSTDLGVVSGARALSDFVGDTDPSDCYKFTLAAPGRITATLNGTTSNADVYLYRDTNNSGSLDSGETLTYSILNGTSTDTFTDLRDAGTYFVTVVPGSTFYDRTNYSLGLNVQTTASAVDPGETLGTATDLGMVRGIRTVADFVGDTDPSDRYKFTLAAPGRISVTLSGLTDNADIYLYRDANNNGSIDSGETVAYSTRSGSSDDTLTAALTTGTYYVSVNSGSIFDRTNYSLTLSTPAVVVDFNAGGLWRWNGTWQQLSSANPIEIDTDDFGNVVASFPGGLSRWVPGSGWSPLSSAVPQQTELTANGVIFSDFASSGLWRWAGSWQWLSSGNATDLEVSDNGSAFAEFGDGLWRWSAGSWLHLSSAVAQDYQVDDQGNLFGDFGFSGLWRWSSSAGWSQLTGADPTRLTVSDNGQLFADFSSGLSMWTSGSGWAFLTSARATELDTGADGTLYVRFGSGTWRWASSSGWNMLSSGLTEEGAVCIGGDYFADFGAAGLWHWTTAGWEQLSSANPFGISARR